MQATGRGLSCHGCQRRGNTAESGNWLIGDFAAVRETSCAKVFNALSFRYAHHRSDY